MAHYDTQADPYLDPITQVLQNLLGITNATDLAIAEANITAVAIAALMERPVDGTFDMEHFAAVHKHLFADIYSWAGEFRRVEMAKDSTRFANAEFLEKAARTTFASLQHDLLDAQLSPREYIERLAHHYAEVNLLHPFREGNGRTQRAFFSLLAAQRGDRILWERMGPNQNVTACAAAYHGDESGLVTMFSSLYQRGSK